MRQRRGFDSQVVKRDGGRIIFLDRVNATAHREYMWRLADCRARGYQDIILDFSQCDGAFPNGMIPLLTSADALRREGIGISVALPVDEDLARLFHNANWAHFLEPEKYPQSNTVHDRHLSTYRFRTPEEQHHLVNAFMDVIMRSMPLERNAIAGLEWSINEITDNVLNHAQCDDGGIVQVSTFKDARKIAFGVADSGRGILASLQEGHPYLQSDAQAIGEAVKSGVTRNPDVGQGNGITGTLRIAAMTGGTFEITSGLSQLIVRGGDSRTYERNASQRLPGTLVYAEFGLDKRFNLAEALGFSGTPHQPVDVIEVLYQTEKGDATVLKLREESSGFGSRPAGRQLRTKCLNLLNAEPNKPLLLDWSGVPLVSSSFADELVGKLFVLLGPLGFSARVRNVGLEALVRGLIDKAIMQRMSQAVAGMAEGPGILEEQEEEEEGS